MPNYPIDLGKKMGDGLISPPSMPEKHEKYYPCLYLDWDGEYDLPKSGEMTIRFRRKSETTRENDRGTTQTVELEVREILDVEADKTSKKESGSEALDKYKKELE